MSQQSLEDRIQQAGNPVELLRNAQVGPYVFPIESECSNWRDEQESWRKTAVFFDQSHHMTDHYFRGRDAVRLFQDLGINSFKNFGRNKAKQIVVCNYDGYVIGDSILFAFEEDLFSVVNRPNAGNWIQFHAETGGYDVEVDVDHRSVSHHTGRRKRYRYEVQGPNALEILTRATGEKLPDIRFFNMGELKIAGRDVRALRHGMAGAPGLELMGPFEEKDEIKAAVFEAGKDLGLLEGGARTYSTVAHESGWVPSELPAIYSGDKMKSYREWLPGNGFEANASLGGSFVSDNIEDWYLTPMDIGYSHILKFDHDFIGRQALEEKAKQPHKKKVTLLWNNDDVIRVFASLFEQGDRYKYMDIPASHYATYPYDAVYHNGQQVGFSLYPVYTSNFRRWISLALLDEGVGDIGSEVEILWGEPDGGSAKPLVERHVQTEMRATIAPCPISDVARETYRA
ncbi:MAG: aminomethyl transferase family protein [Gammaproteobacteria bacterium]|nr:aminomethyl transferase family protein [Gammaproteobacteria bacterium]